MLSDANFKCYTEDKERKTFVEMFMHSLNKTHIAHPPIYTSFVTVIYLTEHAFTMVLEKSGSQ